MERDVEGLAEDVVHVPPEGDIPSIFRDVLVDVAITVDLDQIEFSLRTRVFSLCLDRFSQLREELRETAISCETEVLISQQVSDRGDRLDVVTDVA